MKTDYRLVLLIILTVAASGCASTTQNTDSTSGTGPISINSFEGVPNPASADRTTSVNLELENTGDADATTVAARLFGPTFASSNTDELAWRDSNGGDIKAEERTMSFGTLTAPGENTPSIPKRKSVQFTAPALGQGREVHYNFKASVFYQYETTASTDFKLVSGTRFQEEGLERTEATLESSTGPVDLEIRGTTPKIFYRDDNTQGVESEVCIRVTNDGSGSTFLNSETGEDDDSSRIYDVEEEDKNKVELTIQDVANVKFDAKNTPNEKVNTETVELVGGNEGFQCFDMTARNLGGTDEQNINTQITANYGYTKETETTVTVEGRRGLENTPDETTDDTDSSNEDESESDNENQDSSSTDQTTWEFKEEYQGTKLAEDQNPNEVCPQYQPPEDYCNRVEQ